MQKVYGNLSEFNGKDIELYRSTDLVGTAIYFGGRQTEKAFFEIMLIKVPLGENLIFIRYPNTNHFVEMVVGGGGSWGDIEKRNGTNVWENKYKAPFSLCIHGENMLYSVGEEVECNFNFLKRVACTKTHLNVDQIEINLSRRYLKIPVSVRKVMYTLKTNEDNPKFILVDYPAYKFTYSNIRLFVVDNEEVKELKNVKCVIHGNTFIIYLNDNGTEHIFVSPCGDEPSKFDDINLITTSDNERQNLITLLDLDVVELYNL